MDPKSWFPIRERRPTDGLWMILVLAVLLAWVFRASYAPGRVAFSNDGPLGRLLSDCHRLPDAFTGVWQDLNSVGYREGGAIPNITFAIRWLLGPFGFAKFYPVLSLLILGVGAWTFFRQLKLAPLACFLGTLAAVLNSSFFSVACWGVGSHAITIGMTFLALAALADRSAQPRWLRLAVAGLAVGMGVSEGADIGALLSLYVAAFVLYQAWEGKGAAARRIGAGAGQVAGLALVAIVLAAQPISVLVETQIKGVNGAQQAAMTGETRWEWATKWSLPKREALGLLIPGLFGYLDDTPNGGQYWGAAGRDAVWERYFQNGATGAEPRGVLRFTGGGNYTGILVVLVALWTVLQAWRKSDSVFSPLRKRWIGFWVVVAVGSLLLAFGKFAPFYRFLFALPLGSTVRNPAKFIHPVNFALVTLFAYGIHGLYERYIRSTGAAPQGIAAGLKVWWQEGQVFDRRWVIGCFAALAACLLGWVIYAQNSAALQSYLQLVRFDATTAQAIARFSIAEVGWSILFLALAEFLMMLVLSGALRGKRAGWTGIILGLFLVLDLGRANQPWLISWDYRQKYASNPIIDTLRHDPTQHRVAIMPFLSGPPDAILDKLYHVEWAQHQFPFYNIQTLDIVQMSRTPEDLAAFDHALQFDWSPGTVYRLTRRWQLTNTRYLVGGAPLLNVLNREVDPTQHRFQLVSRFNLPPKFGNADPTRVDEVTVVPAPDGQYGLFEFKGALPRAKLFTQWQVETNPEIALAQVTGPAFDPESTVLVSTPMKAPFTGTPTNQPAGAVRYETYSPKNFVLRTDAKQASVLLVNDRFDPNWNVLVDGQKGTLLRCNYLMRGVYLPGGAHRVEFQFRPPIGALYVSLLALALALLLLGWFCRVEIRQKHLESELKGASERPLPDHAQFRPS